MVSEFWDSLSFSLATFCINSQVLCNHSSHEDDTTDSENNDSAENKTNQQNK